MVREGRTVNLWYRPARGKFRVALSHRLHPGLVPVPRSSRDLRSSSRTLSNLRSELPISLSVSSSLLPLSSCLSLSLTLASLGFTRNGWMNGVRCPRHAQLFAYTPVSPAKFSDYSPSERRANNNPAMTRSSLDHPQSSAFPPLPSSLSSKRNERESVRRVDRTNTRLEVVRPFLSASFSLSRARSSSSYNDSERFINISLRHASLAAGYVGVFKFVFTIALFVVRRGRLRRSCALHRVMLT